MFVEIAVDIEFIKLIVLVVAGFFAGIGWNSFWKKIDFMLKEWIEQHGILGVVLETLGIDLMHHSKTAYMLLVYALYYLYPSVLATFIIAFALGMLLVDLPKEKDRILRILKLVLKQAPAKEIEEEITELMSQEQSEENENMMPNGNSIEEAKRLLGLTNNNS